MYIAIDFVIDSARKFRLFLFLLLLCFVFSCCFYSVSPFIPQKRLESLQTVDVMVFNFQCWDFVEFFFFALHSTKEIKIMGNYGCRGFWLGA